MNKSVIFILISLILFISLGQAILYLEKLPFLDLLYSNMRLILFPLILYISYKTRIIWNNLFSLLVIYFLIILFSSIKHNSQSLVPLISLFITSTSFILCLVVGAKIDFSRLLKIIRNVFIIYVYLNFIFILIYPDGIWKDITASGTDEVGRYLVGGNYNQMGASMIVSIIVSAVYYLYTRKGKALVFLNILVSMISLFIVGSKTSLVGISLFTIFMLLKPTSKKSSKLLYGFIIFYIFFQFQAVFLLTDLSKNGLATYFIENILHKDTSFSMRTNIWLRASVAFFESPVDGWGYQDKDWYEENIGGVSTHNFVYSILLKGGIILLFDFILIMLNILNNERKYRTVYTSTAMFGLWVLLFMMIMEVYNIIYLLSMISLVYITIDHSKNLISNKENVKIKYNYSAS